MKINKILGKRGRITIPYAIRMNLGFSYNDVVSFEEQDNNTVIIRREKLCDGCKNTEQTTIDKPTDETTLLDFLDGLEVAEQSAALIHFSVKLAQLQGGGKE